MEIFTEGCEQLFWVEGLLIGALLLAGLNIPISEDLILITAGAFASSCAVTHPYLFYLPLFIGCWIAAWEAYFLGRFLGPKLLSWFLTEERMSKVHKQLERWGIWTFLIVRFIPGGARNALFMTAGLGKMAFPSFIARDLFPCFFSSFCLFQLGFSFETHFDQVKSYLTTAHRFTLPCLFVFLFTLFLCFQKRDKKQKVG